MRRLVAALLARLLPLALLVAACGDDPPAASKGDLSSDRISAAAKALVADHGGPAAFALAVVALDHGYAVEQFLAAEAFTPDGRIAGTEPAGQPAGLIDLDATAVPAAGGVGPGVRAVTAYDDEPGESLLDAHYSVYTLRAVWELARQTADRPFTETEKAERTSEALEAELVAVVLGLAARGYGLDQILDALLEGRVTSTDGRPACVVIGTVTEDAPVQVDPPRAADRLRPCDQDSAATADPSAASAVEPRTWEGRASVDAELFGQVSDSLFVVERAADGGYDLTGFIESRRDSPPTCSWSILHTVDASGTQTPDGSSVDFVGSYEIDETVITGSDCAESDDAGEFTMTMSIATPGEDVLTGSPFPYTELRLR